MRTHPILLLAVGLTLAACDDSGGPSTGSPSTGGPSSDGTLVVSTSTGGGDPDQDGYLLTVDGVDSVALDPTGTVEIDLVDGQHTLRLLGVAEHCSVAPGTPLEVDVPSQGTTSVAFEVSCPATGVRITTTTTGLDFDTDGYRVEVDGTDRGILPAIGTVVTRLEPGNHTIALNGLSPNCTIVGPGSHTVTTVASEIAIDFAVACTATSGVIGVVVEASGSNRNGEYEALVDGASPFTVLRGTPGYLTGVPAGDHVVSLVAPVNCSVETDPQSVTVTVGALIRDTVEVTFAVVCQIEYGALRISVPTTGQPPSERYQVSMCDSRAYPTMCLDLGRVAPNDILVARVPALDRELFLHLRDVPERCRAGSPIGFSVAVGDTLNIAFPVTCSA